MTESMIQVHLTRTVFVAGGTPGVTYNPRQGQRIERSVARYLSESGKALTIHGPSKSGKTSLVQRLLPKDRAFWLQGQDISSLDDFWSQLGTQLAIGRTRTESRSSEKSVATQLGVSVGVPKVAGGAWDRTDGEKTIDATSNSADVHLPDAVRSALADVGKPIVIDDFHFIADETKRGISRAIKTIVRTSPLILIAVPSEAFELVRAEPEMGLRVWSLGIPPWDETELRQIADNGFPLLNLVDRGGQASAMLAQVSYRSPFIMQQLCYDLVRWELEVEETAAGPVGVVLPEHLDRFLGESADRTPPPLFDRLLAGPARKGTERLEIVLKGDGTKTDIYGAVLTAMQHLVPPMEHLERSVNAEVQRICESPVQGNRVNNALRQMNDIADKYRGDSDPVLRLRDEKLFIQDAQFAFFLRHGSWSPTK